MCNLYSVTKGQTAIVAFTRAMRDRTGNLRPMPGVPNVGQADEARDFIAAARLTAL